MSHIIAAVVGKSSDAAAEPGSSTSHQPGVSPPLSPINVRDEEIELTAPKAVVPRPRPSSTTSDKLGLTPMTGAGPESPTDVFAAAGWSDAARIPSAGYAGITPGSEEGDPLLLRSRLVGENDLRRRPSGKGGRKAEKNVKRFYEEQNEHIERLLKPIHAHGQDDDNDRQDNALKVKIAVYGSFAANCLLAILQLYAAISSLSLSLFATAADSVFDPFANLALLYLHRKSTRVDERKWPTGGSRFENVGNTVYAFLMGTVSCILVVESIRDLASHNSSDDTNQLHIPSLVAVGVAFFVKLSLFFYCFALRRFSSQIQVLWEDHRNDLGINGLGIITSALGSKIAWWIDPAGAMVISVIIITSWSITAARNFKELAGYGAPPDFLQLVTYAAWKFHDKIEKIDAVKAYHTGPLYTVEVDVVFDRETPLWQSHDVSEALQNQLESLPNVDRAFVHCDYEVTHDPEHRRKVV